MRTLLRVGLLLLTFSLLSGASQGFAQNPSQRPEGWQGPWLGDWQGPKPAPQGGLPRPGSQQSIPSGKQVMEIPSHPQSPPEPPRQQADIPSRLQPKEPRPTQFITVTVTDQQGRYVSGLQSQDFEVYEDEEPQKITYFNTGEKEPFSMGILVDTSGSMHGKIDRARFALRRLIDSIRPRDEIFIAAFSTQPRLLQDFTDSRVVLTRAIGLLHPAGGTALYDAMLDGLFRVLQGNNPKKALFIISDGLDQNSYSSLDRAIDAARRAGVLIYSIGITDQNNGFGSIQIGPVILGGGGSGEAERGNRVLREATEQTGGKLFTMRERDVLDNDSVLDAAVQTISRELRSQYTVGYTPTRSGPQYRKVRAAVKRADADRLTVRSQKGYASDSQNEVARNRR